MSRLLGLFVSSSDSNKKDKQQNSNLAFYSDTKSPNSKAKLNAWKFINIANHIYILLHMQICKIRSYGKPLVQKLFPHFPIFPHVWREFPLRFFGGVSNKRKVSLSHNCGKLATHLTLYFGFPKDLNGKNSHKFPLLFVLALMWGNPKILRNFGEQRFCPPLLSQPGVVYQGSHFMFYNPTNYKGCFDSTEPKLNFKI